MNYYRLEEKEKLSNILFIMIINSASLHTVQFGEFSDRNSSMTFLYFNQNSQSNINIIINNSLSSLSSYI